MSFLRAYSQRLIWPPFSSGDLARLLPDYLDRHVRSSLADSGEPLKLDRIATGSNTLVHRWTLPSGRSCFVRAWPSDAREHPAREHAHVSGLFSGAGLRVPRVLFIDSSFRTMRKWRMEILVEDQAEGCPLRNEEGETWPIESLALDLAKLHGTLGTAWGKPWRPINDRADPSRYWQIRLAKFRERITPATSGLDAAIIDQGLKRLRDLLNALMLEHPVLVHNDINPVNLFMNRAGKLMWIDFGTVEYGLPEQDLMKVRYVLGSDDDFGRFMRVYEASLATPRSLRPENMAAFAHLFLWERINSRVKRSARRRERRKDDAAGHLQTEQRKIEAQLRGMLSGEITMPERMNG